MSSIDVVVPCYKYGHFLSQCVQSVLAQHGPSVRVLIIDDASPDNTHDVATALARCDPRVSVIRHASNRGHTPTYNEGLEWASGDYMLLLSADDYLLPGALARAAHVLDARPDVGLVFGKAFGGTPEGLIRDDYLAGRRRDETEVEILTGERFLEVSGCRAIVPTPTAVVRVALQKRLGYYRIDLPHTSDMEMWYRFAAHGGVGVLGAFQAVYRLHGSNMSCSYFTSYRLPDLRHRQAAIDTFFRHDGVRLPRAQALHRSMIRALAVDAVGYASAAFNDGDFEACSELTRYARTLAPGVRRSAAWIRLACKRRLGLRRWRAIAPVVRNLRKAAGGPAAERTSLVHSVDASGAKRAAATCLQTAARSQGHD
jgi:glycosyltransferase involved in cell wall biosynthesis